ncbi:MAG: DNA sulfur modification protein DndB [Dehalococcoidia bacterium]|nr:DNA sulfur modification protein DndB [Dehalococcoidia bacterium]
MASITVPAAIERWALRMPAHRFRQGGRTAYCFSLDLAQLDGLLPQRVDEDVIRDANRRLLASHAKKIEEYLLDRDDWVLGSILLGVAPEAVEFTPYPDDTGKPSATFGELRIAFNKLNTMRLLDGQHRRRAIQDALSALKDRLSEEARAVEGAKRTAQPPGVTDTLAKQLAATRAKIRQLESASLVVILYEEAEISALRQMFADAAKQKPIDAVTKAQFDERDAFNQAARDVADVSSLFSGRIEMNRSTVARTSESILAFNQLATILKTLMFGYYGRVSRVRNIELLADNSPAVDLGVEWADDFLVAARVEYERLADESEAPDLTLLRSTTLAYNATVLRVLAAVFYHWRTEVGDDWKPLAAFLRKQSFKPGQADGLFVKAGLVAAGGSTPVARRQEVVRAIQSILRSARKDAGL